MFLLQYLAYCNFTASDSTALIQYNPTHNGGRTMFTELMPLLRKRRLLLTISLVEGDTIRATVVPQKASETDDNALTTPLAITGTAEELDRDLPQQLWNSLGAPATSNNPGLCQSRNGCCCKAAREEARKKSSKPSVSTTPTTPVAQAAAPFLGTRGTLAVCAAVHRK